MKRIALFAGTTEGRKIAELLNAKNIETDVFVVSSYGADLLPQSSVISIHTGRLSKADMEQLFIENKYEMVFDATHPYAAEVTGNIYQAAEQSQCRYLRIRRDCHSETDEVSCETQNEKILAVGSVEEAVRVLKNTTGNILVSTGSKELHEFCRLPDYENRIFARVLPSVESAQICKSIGIKGRHLIMMQGPFSTEMNRLMIQETKAAYLVTKHSGKTGGFREKFDAVMQTDAKMIMIREPDEQIPAEKILSEAEAEDMIRNMEKQYDTEDKINAREIALIGMGPGAACFVSDEAVAAIRKSDLLIGSNRMLELAGEAADVSKHCFCSYQADQIETYMMQHPEYKKISFLYSGDIDIYSGAQQILRIFHSNDRIQKIHGISSVDYMAELCGYQRNDLYLMSVHGRNADVAEKLKSKEQVIVLLGGSASFSHINRSIIDTGYRKPGKKLEVILGENLSYSNESITRGNPADFLSSEIASLSIAVYRWTEAAGETEEQHSAAIPRIMIAAAKSGSGKTTVTCGLIRAFQNRGKAVSSFKCGPDYIDPMFHAGTLGVKTGNLDSFFTGQDKLKQLLLSRAEKSDIAVLEGVMGYYDGLGGISERASSCEIAEITECPVILMLDAKGASLSLAPVLEGILNYHEKTQIRGIILNRVTAGFYPTLKRCLEKELLSRHIAVRILGYLPENPDFQVPSRHLGLVTPNELRDRQNWAEKIAQQLEQSVEVDEILNIAGSAPAVSFQLPAAFNHINDCKTKVRIAVASDEAFSFYYSENEDFLREHGAEPVYFSPVHDANVPEDIDGMIIGGGYPELFQKELEANAAMRTQIRLLLSNGLPTIAECGGFMYLLKELKNQDNETSNMCGVIPATGFNAGHLTRFGYFEGKTRRDGLFGKAGTILRGHSFHYWDADRIGDGIELKKPTGERTWNEEFYTDTIAAGFPHFYYPGNEDAILHFLGTCRTYKKRRADA